MTTPEELDALVARLLDGPQRVYRDLHAAKKAATAITALRARVAELEAATDQLQYIASANATRAEKADTDLIRRGAAIKAVTDADRDCRGAHGARENIAALPAHPVQEPPSPGVTAGAAGPVSDADFLRDAGMDGAKWAAGFKAIAERLGHHGMDEGWLIGWFCNAIMAGYDEAERRYRNPTPAPVVPAEGLDALIAEIKFETVNSEIDRYLAGRIITALRSAPPVGARVSIPSGLIDALRSQRQIDADGCEVAVSRQACDEAAAILAALLPAGEGVE